MKNSSIILYITGSLIGFLLIIYVVYLLRILFTNIGVVANTGPIQPAQIATFDLEKFGQIKKAQ